ncbi:MAG: RHS repeat-associated core domain-containing protein [Bacteroidia bacterium]|nr:RHS repeat-associated core domain-containing protein [Bacteroidia bacterium]
MDHKELFYDASGNKLKKTVGAVNSYYQGSVLKLNGTDIVMTGEGRAVKNGTWSYEYDLKDHLGNTRVSFSTETGAALPQQYKDYYPFGLEMARWYTTLGTPTKHLYNGKELQDEYGLGWYDYGARFYDPTIGRWNTIDGKAEKYYSLSPYIYAINIPVKFIDPDGNDIYIYYPTKDQNGQTSRAYFKFNGTNGGSAPQNKFVQNAIQAYNYNIKNGGGDNLKAAATNPDIKINLLNASEYGETDSYDNAGNVYWNPYNALATKNGLYESPATGLEHEFDHAVDDFWDHDAHIHRGELYDKQYGNQEERRVITGSEKKTATKNGEFKPGQVRNSHGGKGFDVNDPNANMFDFGVKRDSKNNVDWVQTINSWLQQNPNIIIN